MKTVFVSFVLLSIIFGLNGHCVRHQPGEKCSARVFQEPEPKEIHYIYQGESCDCPKYHDVVVEKPVAHEKIYQPEHYEYDVEVPKQRKNEEEARYIFDVRVEQPVEKTAVERRESYDYNVHVPQTQRESESVRYIFDSRVEQPVKPCADKPWQGLVAQVDRVLMPAKGCKNSDHTPENCNCGCQSCGQQPEACTCGNDGYKLPIVYNPRYAMKSDDSQNFPAFIFPDSMALPRAYEISSLRQKRDVNTEKKRKSKRREISLPRLKSLKKKSPKELKPIEPIFKRPKKLKLESRQSRPKRKHDSPCGYTYESCDPKKHNRDGCPLCYKCKCEPVNKPMENAKFSPHDIKVPYKLVKHDEAPGRPAMNQEFDHEPPSYTGLNEPEMYKKYIKQVISKYPEHMSRKMPDIQDQQQDLMKFMSELSKSNKSEGSKIDNEDVRYKMMDNAMDMYKYYEKAISGLQKNPLSGNDGKFFKKRGTVLEVIELNPEDNNGSFYGFPADSFGDNYSASQ